METNNPNIEELNSLANDMLSNPEKYGLTQDFIRQWVFGNIENGASVLSSADISQDDADGLADALISAYRKKAHNVRQPCP